MTSSVCEPNLLPEAPPADLELLPQLLPSPSLITGRLFSPQSDLGSVRLKIGIFKRGIEG